MVLIGIGNAGSDLVSQFSKGHTKIEIRNKNLNIDDGKKKLSKLIKIWSRINSDPSKKLEVHALLF